MSGDGAGNLPRGRSGIAWTPTNPRDRTRGRFFHERAPYFHREQIMMHTSLLNICYGGNVVTGGLLRFCPRVRLLGQVDSMVEGNKGYGGYRVGASCSALPSS